MQVMQGNASHRKMSRDYQAKDNRYYDTQHRRKIGFVVGLGGISVKQIVD